MFSTVEDLQYNWGGICEYSGGCSVEWGTSFSTLGDVQYNGVKHYARVNAWPQFFFLLSINDSPRQGQRTSQETMQPCSA